MQVKISKEISKSLMIANLLAMILVVAIHYSTDVNMIASYGPSFNSIFQEFVKNGIARSAVPIFALLSGFFLIERIGTYDAFRLTLKNKLYTLLIPYLVASIAILSVSIVLKMLFKQVQNFQFDLHSVLYRVIAHPLSEQFWFLRDLLILTLISPIIFNVNRFLLYGMGMIFFCLWSMDIQPFPTVAGWYLLNTETLFFFWLGGLIIRIELDIYTIMFCDIRIKMAVLMSWIGLIAVRVFVDPNIDVWYVRNYTIESILLYKAAIFVGVIGILQLSTTMRDVGVLTYASGFTFFVYLFHLQPIFYFRRVTVKIVEEPYLFYIDFPVAVFLVFLLAHITSKYFPRLYLFMSGGRSPAKVLQRIH